MKGRNRKTNITIVLFVLICLIIFVALIVSISLISLIIISSKNRVKKNENNISDVQKNEYKNYQILKYTPSTHEKYTGLITIPSFQLDPLDFESSYDENKDTHTLISNIGEPEYICQGKCVCVDHKRRTIRTPIILKQGLLFLLTALTSTLAYQTAKNEFDERCKNEELLSSLITHNTRTCEEIISEVEVCTTMAKGGLKGGFKLPPIGPEKYDDGGEEYEIADDEYKPNFEKLTNPDGSEKETADRMGLHRFLCLGNCLFNKKRWNEWVKPNTIKPEIGERICREKSVSKEVFAFRTAEHIGGRDLTTKELNDQARRMFIEVLDTLCTLAEVEIGDPKDLHDPKKLKLDNFCLGHVIGKKEGGKINLSIDCREMENNFSY